MSHFNSPPTAFRQLEFSLLIGSVALMNHSCCPNVIVTYKGTLAEVRAVQEIHPGDEVRVQQWTRAVVTGRAARSTWYPVATPAFPGYGIRFETWLDVPYGIHKCHFLWPDRNKKYIRMKLTFFKCIVFLCVPECFTCMLVYACLLDPLDLGLQHQVGAGNRTCALNF